MIALDVLTECRRGAWRGKRIARLGLDGVIGGLRVFLRRPLLTSPSPFPGARWLHHARAPHAVRAFPRIDASCVHGGGLACAKHGASVGGPGQKAKLIRRGCGRGCNLLVSRSVCAEGFAFVPSARRRCILLANNTQREDTTGKCGVGSGTREAGAKEGALPLASSSGSTTGKTLPAVLLAAWCWCWRVAAWAAPSSYADECVPSSWPCGFRSLFVCTGT